MGYAANGTVRTAAGPNEGSVLAQVVLAQVVAVQVRKMSSLLALAQIVFGTVPTTAAIAVWNTRGWPFGPS